jgi:hypothetical protein
VKASPAALAAFRRHTGLTEHRVLYVTPNTTVNIGYTFNGAAAKDRIHPEGVSARQLQRPHVQTAFAYERVYTGRGLFFLAIKQQPGPIHYRWINPEGEERHVLVCAAEPTPDLVGAISETARYLSRRESVWKVAFRGKLKEEVADQVLKSVDKFSHALTACDVIKYFVHGIGAEAGREKITLLLEGDPSGIKSFLNDQRISVGNAAPKVLAAALIALG